MHKMKKYAYTFVLTLLWALSCTRVDESKLFSLMPQSHTNITFTNVLGETEEFNVLEYGYMYNGGGVAAGDLNNDGLIDLYFTGNMVGSHLYLNQGNMEFKEMAKEAGVFAEGLWNTGVTMADVNADGFMDLYVCRSAAQAPSKRRNLLFINNGDLTFSEKGEEYGVADTGYSTQAAFFDYDLDGDLDLYVLNHSTQEYAGFGQITPSLKKRSNPDFADKLYRNDNGTFVNATKESGLVSNVLGFGLGLAISDLNNDGWPDIYVSNDYNEQDYLYINDRDLTFTESLAAYMGHTPLFSMGNDVADLNNDGYMDVLALDMLPEGNYRQKMVSGPDNYEKFSKLQASGFYHQTMRNMLQLNNQGRSFSEIGQFAGVSNTDWSWAGLMADFDNDGHKDIFITNGYKRDYTNMDFMNFAVQQKLNEDRTGTKTSILDLVQEIPATVVPNYMYASNGDLTFAKKNKDWGFERESLSNGALYADLDNDGDLDLVVNNIDEPAFVYRNNTDKQRTHNNLQISLEGPEKNPSGIGAKVRVSSQGNHQYQEQMPVRGYQSSMIGPLTFGLGQAQAVDSLTVFWPGGKQQTLFNVPINTKVVLRFLEASQVSETERPAPSAYFKEVERTGLLPLAHRENEYNDFKRERLLPQKRSTQGPRLATADVNGDGLEDVFVPGPIGEPSRLLLQQKDGGFKEHQDQVFAPLAAAEDVNALFFDADADGDQDLYVVSGGNELEAGDMLLQDRLYLNDGKGGFTEKKDALPEMKTSGLAIAVNDMDGDGDLDVFVGGRLVPGQYPTAPQSFMLQNNGTGTFGIHTKKWDAQEGHLGMVTDAAFADMDADGKEELVVVGEWEPIRIFEYTEEGFKPKGTVKGLENTEGWWNRVLPMDVDGDGKMDLVLGNHGLNSQLKASQKEPVSLYHSDIDGNGSIDPVLTSFIQGKEYPVFSKDDLTDQLVGLKGKYVNYSDYANAQMEDIFTEQERSLMDTLRARTFTSGILKNMDNLSFRFEPLPASAQWAPIFAMYSEDVNKDGLQDLILAGNFFGSRVKYGRYDANRGLLLLGTPEGAFSEVSQNESGLHITGEIRDVVRLRKGTGEPRFLFARNNGPIRVFKLNGDDGNER
ncbi:VCBS repeat-containing protein [Maribacter sp. 2307ULW6-5]|uniref:VCBS repeat-containing protein n=1 Tax=Maribacter sp. 2307ULW6-5 TaxID=3386275 RepID=UPI0039BD4F6B